MAIHRSDCVDHRARIHVQALLDASLAVEVPYAALGSDWPGAIEAVPMEGACFLALSGSEVRTRLLAVAPNGDCELLESDPVEPRWSAVGPHVLASDAGCPPASGSVLRRDRLSHWWPGTYLLYQRGIEYFRPGEEPPWLEAKVRACGTEIGDSLRALPAYRDEATDELVPVLRVR